MEDVKVTAVIKCPKCGSKYVECKKTQETYKQTLRFCKCISCNESFENVLDKGCSDDRWLITLFLSDGEGWEYNKFLQVYQNVLGEFQYFVGGGFGRGRSYDTVKPPNVSKNYGEAYVISIYEIRGRVSEIYMNEELASKALQNDAMKLMQANDGGWRRASRAYEEPAARFVFGNWRSTYEAGEIKSEALANDICAWLKSTVPEWNNQQQKEEIETAKESKKKSSGCYVATCVYGSYDCPAVWTLRRFRDDTLGATWLGRLFIRTYYAVSPTLVKWFGKTKWFRGMFKPMLDKMVRKLNAKGIADTPYQDKNW